MKKIIAILATVAVCQMANALTYTAVTYDEKLFQSDMTLDSDKLLANVWMGVEGNKLCIKIQNISQAGSVVAGEAAGGVSGIALNLGEGYTIIGGSVNPIGTVNPDPWDLTKANSQWGWRQGSIQTGGLLGALYTYDSEASTMDSDTDNSFGAGPVDGLNYYAYSSGTTPYPGNPWVIDTIEICLNIEDAAGLTVSDIDAGKIAVIFGSATSGGMPDGGSTLALLGCSLIAMRMMQRRKA